MSAPLDLGTLVVKLAADVSGLAKTNAEMKKSVDSLKSMARAATGVFDGTAGAVQGFGRSCKQIGKAVGDIFGDKATAQGQKWGREIQSALGLSSDNVTQLKRAMEGLDGAAEIVGQSMGSVSAVVKGIGAIGLPVLAATAAAVASVAWAVYEVEKNWGDLKLFWEDLWRDTEQGAFDAFLDRWVERWASATQKVIGWVQSAYGSATGGPRSDIDLGPDAPARGGALTFASQSVEATRAAFGSSGARAQTWEKTKSAVADFGEDMKKKLKAVMASVGGFLGTTPGKLPEFERGKGPREQKEIEGARTEFVSLTDVLQRSRVAIVERTRAEVDARRASRVEGVGQGMFLQRGDLGRSAEGGMAESAINTFTSSLAAGAKTVGAAIQGFTAGFKSGGIWGGLLGAISGLLTQSRGFALIMSILENSFKSLSDILGNVFLVLGPFMAIGDVITQLIGQILTPILKALAGVLSVFYPIIQGVTLLVAKIAEGLAWMWNTMADFLKQIFGGLQGVFNGLASAIGGVLRALASVVNALFRAGAWMLRAAGDILGAIPLIGDKIKGALQGAAAGLEGMQISAEQVNALTGGVSWEFARLSGTLSGVAEDLKVDKSAFAEQSKIAADSTWAKVYADIKAKDAAIALAESQDSAAKSATSFAESLTNIPTGYRVAAARYDASLPSFAAGAFVPRPTAAIVGDAPGGEYVVPAGKMGGITINISGAGSPESVAREVMRRLEAEGYASRGARGTLAPAYTGA